MIGVLSGVLKAGSIRRTGDNRRWDAERLRLLRGSPWKLMPDEAKEKNEESSKTKVRFMTEEEKDKGIEVEEDEIIKPGRVRLLKEDFLEHGFTEGCRGCKALLNNKGSHGHSEKCRIRMEKALESSVDGKDRNVKLMIEAMNGWRKSSRDRKKNPCSRISRLVPVVVKDPIR